MSAGYYYVYLLASKRNDVLYCGVTNDLVRRVWEHREGFVPGFTARYNVKKLVWFEVHETAIAAIAREKQIKKWRRSWKDELIVKSNPRWQGLFDQIV